MASKDPQRPNVLFIISDDQGPWALGCNGNPEIKTPNLDRMAQEGIRFENFFCTSPVCSPARASLLTGDIPSRHGVQDYIRGGHMGSDRIDYLAGQQLLTEVVAEAGYRCGLVGKWHLGASDVPRPEFVKWFAHQAGGGPYYDAPMIDHDQPCNVEGYLTDVLGEVANDFIDAESERGEPFWLNLNFTAPHSPWINEHPKEFTDLYANCAFESCPDEPLHADFSPEIKKDPELRRPRLMGYFAAVTAMDAAIGRVMQKLESEGLAESTLVVFTSDNGMNCGHHGFWGKGNGTRPQNMYDTSVKVPCIISQKGRLPANVVNDDLLSGYDIFPTLLDYLGLTAEQARKQPGRSFKPVFDGCELPEEQAVVVYDEYGPVRMVRTRDWKYVHRFPDGPHELFDLRNDSEERANLIGDESFKSVIAELRDRLNTWFADYVDPRRDASTRGVTGRGQIGMAEDSTQENPMFAADLPGY